MLSLLAYPLKHGSSEKVSEICQFMLIDCLRHIVGSFTQQMYIGVHAKQVIQEREKAEIKSL